MKFATIGLAFGILVAGTETAVLQAQPAASTNTALSPKIQFAELIHDFGKVKVNEPAKWDFVFTNTGQAMLEITGVHPGCGCTTAGTWTRQVEPGKTGIIPIQFNAAGGPGPFGKSITVNCNDPSQQTVGLQFKGVLWKPIDVIPTYAVFNGTAESISNTTSIVRIINYEDAPLTLSSPESNNRLFTAELKTTKPGKEFEVVIRPVPPFESENTGGTITVKTSSTNLPVISINTAARIQPALVANPASITLPAGPTTNVVRLVVFLRNNSSTLFSLTDPAVNALGVDVQIKEIEAGKYASLSLTFPKGFMVMPGEKVQLSVKTGLALHPTFEVPVFQFPHPHS